MNYQETQVISPYSGACQELSVGTATDTFDGQCLRSSVPVQGQPTAAGA